MALKHISRPVRIVAGKTFARKYITLGRIMALWPDIIGHELALKTYPIGLKMRKTGTKAANGKPQYAATLEIAASSAEATLLHYKKALILERLKLTAGNTFIDDLMITHAAKLLQPTKPKTPPPLTTGQKHCLSQGIETIEDHDLRAALADLGRWIPQD